MCSFQAPGDRGNVVVDVPAPVVPYVPPITHQVRRRLPEMTVELPKLVTTTTRRPVVKDKTKSADFSSFESARKPDDDYDYEEEFFETDRIDVPSLLDPSAIIYSQSAEPYGQNFPSFISQSIETQLKSTSQDAKKLSTESDVIYGNGLQDQEEFLKQLLAANIYDDSSDYIYDDDTVVVAQDELVPSLVELWKSQN